jgi:type I restriction enzyme S subunit
MMNTWTTKRIKDICEVGRGRVISAQEIESKPGVYPVFSSQSFNKGQMGLIDTFDFEGEYITWTTDGAYAGTVFYRNGKFNCTNVCGTLKEKDGAVSMPFLAYQLSCHAKQHVSYVGNPKLMNNVMAEIQLSMPDDKNEQIKIAEILSTLDQAIEQTEAIIAKQQRIKVGLMQDLLTKGIDENGDIRSEATHEFKDSSLGRIPVEWEVKTVGDIFIMQLGKMLNKKAMEGKSPFPYLGNKNVQWDRIDLSELLQMDFTEQERVKFELKVNDILICEGGEVGRTALWHGEYECCYFQKAIHRLRPIANKYLPELFPRFMSYVISKGILLNFTSQTSIAHLTQEKLAIVPIFLPKLDEQRRIADAFDLLDESLFLEISKLHKMASVKAGLMHDLLSGKVRVTNIQNPTLTPESL